jgi:putative transposase
MDRRPSIEPRHRAAAASFLDKIHTDLPFPVKADGGSEFMAGFEAVCQAKGVALFVLPPRSPQMNGAVAWRYEFYETYDLPSLDPRKPPAPLQPP